MKRIGIFGWGIVAPRSPNIEQFAANLDQSQNWLSPFEGFGPSHFLVGSPEFDFNTYKPWIDAHFEPRKFSQLNEKMGDNAKFAIGAFIQALAQNKGLGDELKKLKGAAHVYVATGLGDLSTQFDIMRRYHLAQRRWNRFWCRDKYHRQLAAYRCASPSEKKAILVACQAPPDPDIFENEMNSDNNLDLDDRRELAREAWYDFWVNRSEGLQNYLGQLQKIEAESLSGDIENGKRHLIRRKMAAKRKLNTAFGCPIEPWNAVDAKLLWNIANIPASQISILGRITGPAFSPVAACSGFGTALKLAVNAIQLGEAKAVVIGATDPKPHPLTVGAFYGARVLSHDGRVSKPFTGLRGTHVAGGACVWIVGDADYLMSRGFTPLGLEILSVAITSDADHIITPSHDGPAEAIHHALREASVSADEVATWDMHATATPGDWTELTNTLEIFTDTARLTARKGIFGHGMSVCGGWELTAQHLGVANGKLFPTNTDISDLHPQIQPFHHQMVGKEGETVQGDITGKINMGVGGINACIICRRWT